jgi:inhibitor of KinA
MKTKEIRNHGYGSLYPTCEPQGDSGLLIRFGKGINPTLNKRVHSLFHELEKNTLEGYVESIPGYCTLLVKYDPLLKRYDDIEKWVKKVLGHGRPGPEAPARIIEVPVIYGGDYGPDLEDVARLHQLSVKEVVRLYCAETYQVYFIGFLPGFPYLGRLPLSLETPRLETPRLKVQCGSVGIAGLQTGIYPMDSPGGWRIIGWTPLNLFRPESENPATFFPGDRVQFIPLRDGKIFR